MTSKLGCVAAAAAFALATAPALAATCAAPGPAPLNHVPPRPPLPSGVTEAMVAQCDPSQDRTTVRTIPAQCGQAPMAPYMAALTDRKKVVVDFRTAVTAWRNQADAYDECILLSVD